MSSYYVLPKVYFTFTQTLLGQHGSRSWIAVSIVSVTDDLNMSKPPPIIIVSVPSQAFQHRLWVALQLDVLYPLSFFLFFFLYKNKYIRISRLKFAKF